MQEAGAQAGKYKNDRALLRKRVQAGLETLLKQEGVDVDPKVETYDYGKFGWIMDPEGNRIELWEPTANK